MSPTRAPMVQAANFGGAFQPGQPVQIAVHSVQSKIKRIARSLAEGYFREPSNRTSAHSIHDPFESVRMVPEGKKAWHCGTGNRQSKGVEHAGMAEFSTAEWLTDDARTMLRLSAHESAIDVIEYGIPIRWLSVVQVARGEAGFCTHNDMRLALGGTSHWDPGPNFPFALYLQYVAEEVAKLTGGSASGGGKPTSPARPSSAGTPAAWPLAKRGAWFGPGGTTGSKAKPSQNVKLIQAKLNRVLAAGLTVDGIYGAATVKAAAEYARRFLPTRVRRRGLVGPVMWGSLKLKVGATR